MCLLQNNKKEQAKWIWIAKEAEPIFISPFWIIFRFKFTWFWWIDVIRSMYLINNSLCDPVLSQLFLKSSSFSMQCMEFSMHFVWWIKWLSYYYLEKNRFEPVELKKRGICKLIWQLFYFTFSLRIRSFEYRRFFSRIYNKWNIFASVQNKRSSKFSLLWPIFENDNNKIELFNKITSIFWQ